jgi:hypothetical protein
MRFQYDSTMCHIERHIHTAVSVPTVWRQTHLSVWPQSLATSFSISLPGRLHTMGIYKICSGHVDELKVNITEAINANNRDTRYQKRTVGSCRVGNACTHLQGVTFKKNIFSGSCGFINVLYTVFTLFSNFYSDNKCIKHKCYTLYDRK